MNHMASNFAPPVSIVVPVRNEQRFLTSSVAGIVGQGYPGPMEIILVVAPSEDDTEQIAERLADGDERIRVIANPQGTTPRAMNLGVAASRYDIIVRVDAHGELGPEYIATAVELLERTGAANVGGIMDAQGTTDFEKAVAAAYTSRLGLGGGSFHLKNSPEGPADTVFLGVYRKADLLAVGGFDPTFDRAQDWELNYRLRHSGREVWFSPRLKVTYRPRSDVKSLATQFFHTGQWRRQVIRTHRDSASLRYLAAPVTVVACAVGAIGGVAGIVRSALKGRPSRLLAGFAVPAGYLGAMTAGSLLLKQPLTSAVRARLPLVLTVMHMSWGAGFIVGLPAPRAQ